MKQSYANYNSQSFNNIWCQLFACYNEILSTNGGNTYDIPHTGSRKTQKIEPFHVDLTIKNEVLPADLTVIQ